ncbi:MAG: hypothetical protein K8R36_00905 [Planctomycetales bacterium]|nr:hypothetical protein [Planctomycetales bacterium]
MNETYGRSQLIKPSAKGLDEPLPALLANVKGGQNMAITWNEMRALAINRMGSDQRLPALGVSLDVSDG